MQKEVIGLPTTAPDLSEGHTTIVDLLGWRATHQAVQSAYTFLSDGETESATLSYRELDERARAIASHLQKMDVKGQRIMLFFPPGLNYISAFLGCLCAGAVAVPAYPPKLSRGLDRLETILLDCGASLALTNSSTLPRVESLANRSAAFAALRLIDCDAIQANLADEWEKPFLEKRTLAFLQYTSGSTATPKGVMVTHGNLLHNQRVTQKTFRQNERSIIVGWLPLYHDMGLIGNIIHTLYLGARCILMSPVDFLRRPINWLKAISRYKATTSGGPNFAYDLCVRKVPEEDKKELDLASWSVAFNGSEPIRAETLRSFSEKFAPCGFREEAFSPCYGLAEATLIVTGKLGSGKAITANFDSSAMQGHQELASDGYSQSVKALISSGKALPEQRIVIVDLESQTECEDGRVGEIWVSSPSVTDGYWNQEAETERSFRAHLSDTGEEPYLRTGDLGFVKEGELFVVGRLKDLIIIRGLNHYPQDIELTVEHAHPSLRPGCGAAFSIEVDGQERLVIAHELEFRKKVNYQEVIDKIREFVAEEHEIEAYAVALLASGSIPKTSSGKIQRRACRAAFLSSSLDIIEKWQIAESIHADEPQLPLPESFIDVDGLRKWLASLLATKLRVDTESIRLEDPLTRYCLDSLAALEFVYSIESALGVRLPLTRILNGSNLSQIASEIGSQCKAGQVHRETMFLAEKDPISEYGLSYNQQALWYIYQLAPDTAAYNIGRAGRIIGDLNIYALHRALQKLVNRHPALRTVFIPGQKEPIQRVLDGVEVSFQQTDVKGWSEAQIGDRIVEITSTPFVLEEGPVFRACLLKQSDEEHILILCVHHIVADLWSMALLLSELKAEYQAEKNSVQAEHEEAPITFIDYVRWQERMLDGIEGKKLWAYWQNQLSGELPTLDLPTDRSRPQVQSFNGDTYSFLINRELSIALKAISNDQNATLYMVLMAAFGSLLYRYTGQNVIPVGSPTAGRTSAELAQVVGYFVNSVVLRIETAGEEPFKEFLGKVRQAVLAAFDHQGFPFPLLVEKLQLPQDPSRSPLFQVMFVYQKAQLSSDPAITSLAAGHSGAHMDWDGSRLEPLALRERFSQFDLTLTMAQLGDENFASFQYSTDLFNLPTIERMSGHLMMLLRGIVSNVETKVFDLAMLTPAEESQLIFQFNDTYTDFHSLASLHKLFEEQVDCTPDSVAVVFENQQISYGELDSRANQVARFLQKQYVGAESIVGLSLNRSIEMVIAMLGILKAGGAYLPLDPTYPDQRLCYMTEDARVKIVIGEAAEPRWQTAKEIQWVEITTEKIKGESRVRVGRSGSEGNAAYVIYTSGSTGAPKGIITSHKAICNRLLWMRQEYILRRSDRVLHKTPLGFDVSVWELFWPLITGACMVIARPGGHREGGYLVDLIQREQVTAMHFVPSMLQVFLQEAAVNECISVKRVICSGEALTVEQSRKFNRMMRAELSNLYGPTEAAVEVTYWRVDGRKEVEEVLIGRPIANTRIYILDKNKKLAPIGVRGEIHIGGEGLGRGYIEKAEMTALRYEADGIGGRAGERIYRTGDIGRWRETGEIEYVGREDQQVKVRGNRIELGEIEMVLTSHSLVNDAIVMLREDRPGEKQLVAYIVPERDSDPTTSEVRRFLEKQLPMYMIPQVFIAIESIPLSPSGKIDRKALHAPNSVRPDLERSLVLPRTPIEEQLAEIWRDVVKIEQVGVHDNFFELGGSSLLAMRVVSRTCAIFGIQLRLPALFQSPTIEGLAVAVTEAKMMQSDSVDAERLLQELEQLPDEEV